MFGYKSSSSVLQFLKKVYEVVRAATPPLDQIDKLGDDYGIGNHLSSFEGGQAAYFGQGIHSACQRFKYRIFIVFEVIIELEIIGYKSS